MRERSMVPPLETPRASAPQEPREFESYYGRPVIKTPTWKTPDVPVYLFVGGMAGVSSLLAEGAALTGRPGLERVARGVAAAGVSVGTVALVHDLGRPERFLNMLRVLKVTSPLSVGSWILAPFGTFASAAFASQVTGLLPWAGRAAGAGAALFGPPLSTYTAALLADTAVPAWHEAHRELPYLFAGSAATAGGGVCMALAPLSENGPARLAAAVGAVTEVAVERAMSRRLGMLGEPYEQGRPGRLMRASRGLTAAGLALSALAGRSRTAAVLAGTAYSLGSLALRFGVFEAGIASSKDPKYTVVPQRQRVDARRAEKMQPEVTTT